MPQRSRCWAGPCWAVLGCVVVPCAVHRAARSCSTVHPAARSYSTVHPAARCCAHPLRSMSLTNLALRTNLTQPFQDRSWIPPYRREKKQNGQFPRWRRDPWAAEGVSARDRDVCAPTLCVISSQKSCSNTSLKCKIFWKLKIVQAERQTSNWHWANKYKLWRILNENKTLEE